MIFIGVKMESECPYPDEIVTFYCATGRPIFYLIAQKWFYHYNGSPLGYLYNNKYLISFSGKYLGWVHNGSIYSFKDGTCAFFTQFSSGAPSHPCRQSRPSRSSRQSRPSRSSKESRPSKPNRKNRWSTNSNESFFSEHE